MYKLIVFLIMSIASINAFACGGADNSTTSTSTEPTTTESTSSSEDG